MTSCVVTPAQPSTIWLASRRRWLKFLRRSGSVLSANSMRYWRWLCISSSVLNCYCCHAFKVAPLLLSPHADRHFGDISVTVFFVCRSLRRILVTDISGMGWRRAMKFWRMVDLGVHHVFSPLVNFGPGVSPPRPKSEKSIMHRTVVSQVRQTGQAVARPV